MTKTNFKKVIETQANGLKISQVDNKEIEQTNDDGTTEKIKYKKVKFIYEHPQENGSKIRARPSFTTPPLEHSRGLKMDNKGVKKLSAFTRFNIDNEDVKLFISSKEQTQIRGWVSQENVKIVTKSGKTFARASRDGDLLASPKEDDETVAAFVKGDVMNVEDQKEIGEDNCWYLVAAGGQEGFFSTMNNKISKLLHADKRCGFSNMTLDQIKQKIKDPVYRPFDPETGKPIEGKMPSAYFKCSYFAARPKEKKKESYARYQLPGFNDCLDLDTMLKSALKLDSAVLLLVDVYIGSGKIIPQYYITDAIVVDIDEIKMPNEMEEELARQSKDEALVAKLREQLAKSKKFEVPQPKKELKEQDEAAQAIGNQNEEEDEEAEDFKDLINNEPKKGTLEDLSASMQENIVIPGLPEDD